MIIFDRIRKVIGGVMVEWLNVIDATHASLEVCQLGERYRLTCMVYGAEADSGYFSAHNVRFSSLHTGSPQSN